jgi:hypothetical protein
MRRQTFVRRIIGVPRLHSAYGGQARLPEASLQGLHPSNRQESACP